MNNNIIIINGIIRHGTDYYYASDIKSVHIEQVSTFTIMPENIRTSEAISKYMYEHYKITEYKVEMYGDTFIYVHYNTGEYYIKIRFKDETLIAGETRYKNIDDAEDAVIEIMSYSTKPFIDKI